MVRLHDVALRYQADARREHEHRRLLCCRGRPGPPRSAARVFAANICVDLLPKAFCRALLPASNAPACLGITADGTTITTAPEPCPIEAPQTPFLTWNGIYAKLGYSGLLAALAGNRPARQSGPSGHTLPALGAHRRTAINVLPLRWFDFRGTFEENLQAWFLLFAALVVAGLTRLSRANIAVLAFAMAVEFGTVDLHLIQLQSVVLPLTNDTLALQGHPPVGPLLPVTAPPSRFRAPMNTTGIISSRSAAARFSSGICIRGNFVAVSWLTLAIGVLSIALGGLRREDTSKRICTYQSQSPPR